jgi:hypothetical protein
MESNPRPTLRGRKLLILRYAQTSKVARTASFGDAVVTRSREQSILRKPEIHMDGNGVNRELTAGVQTEVDLAAFSRVQELEPATTAR